MIYEIHLLEEDTKEELHCFESVIAPKQGDVYMLTNTGIGDAFVVKRRLLLDSDSNRIECLGEKRSIRDVIYYYA